MRLLEHFAEIAALPVKLGGEVSFEWPAYCSCWVQKALIDLIQKLGLLQLGLMVVLVGSPARKIYLYYRKQLICD